MSVSSAETVRMLTFANIIFYMLVASRVTARGRQQLTDEERLNDIIFRNYDSSFRPVYNASEPVELMFGINIINISKLDDIGQILEISVWLELNWKDQRLTWNPSDFSGLEMVRLPTKLLWMPDIVLYNSAEEFRISGEVRAMVHHSGGIFVGPYVKLRSTCILDLTLYPFDDQLCRLIFSSWSHDLGELKILSKSNKPSLAQYTESAVWDLLQSSIENTQHLHICCSNPFSDIVLSIQMRRRFLFNNLLDIFVPSVWLACLTLLTFWLDPASGEKITLSITILVTFTLFQILVSEKTPRTSDFVPLISLYLETCYLTTALVVGIQVFILNLHGLSPILTAVPNCLRVLVLDCMACVLCIDASIDGSQRKIALQRANHRKNRHQSKSIGLAPSSPTYLKQSRSLRGIDKDDDIKSLMQRIKEQENEHIYVGIEEILEELQPRAHARFLKRDYATSCQSLEMGLTRQSRRPVITFCTAGNNADVENNMCIPTAVPPLSAPSTATPGVGISTKKVASVSASTVYQSPVSPTFHSYQQIEGVREKRIPSPPCPSKTWERRIKSIGNKSCHRKTPRLAKSRFEQELLARLLHSVGYMVKREESSTMTNLVIAEWRMIAFVLDRLTFWLFAIITILFVVLYLIALPFSQHAAHRYNLSVPKALQNLTKE